MGEDVPGRLEAALANAQVTRGGMVAPDDSYLYATKSYGGQLYSEMTHRLHDVAGGLVITCPTIADLDNPEIGDYLRKYLRTMDGVSGEDRMRIFHIIRDLTADTYGGWDKVTNQVVGGGMHFQRWPRSTRSTWRPPRNGRRLRLASSPSDATAPDRSRAARRHLRLAHAGDRRRPRPPEAPGPRCRENLAGIVEREVTLGPGNDDNERARLATLLDEGADTDLSTLRAQLLARLADPSPIDPDASLAIYEVLLETVRADLAISKPGYADWTREET